MNLYQAVNHPDLIKVKETAKICIREPSQITFAFLGI
jgi:hypothetical protein